MRTLQHRANVARLLVLTAVVLWLLATLTSAVFAETPAQSDLSRATACPQHFLTGATPNVVGLPENAVELCNDTYAVRWSPRTRDPVYAAEHLTSVALLSAEHEPRLDDFRSDHRLPRSQRAEMSDYADGGYDRGHMAPAHDMPTPEAMRDSFLLSNMVPQVPANNRGPWAQVEETVRTLVTSVYGGEGWAVTGPVFGLTVTFDKDGKVVETRPTVAPLHDRVAVPTQLFKAVYVPGDAYGNRTVVGAWVLDNAVEAHARFVSLAKLRDDYGVDAFPSLPESLKAEAYLPDAARTRTGVGK